MKRQYCPRPSVRGWMRCPRTILAVAIALNMLSVPAVLGNFVGLSWSGSMYLIDESSGDFTLLASGLLSAANSMASNSEGSIYSVVGNGMYEVDPFAATVTRVLDLDTSVDARGIAFGPDDTLYAVRDGGSNMLDLLCTIDTSTGAVTDIATASSGGLQALEFAPDGTLYSWDVGTGGVGGLGLVTIDPVTAILTDVNPNISRNVDVQTLAFDPAGNLYAARNDLFTLNPATAESVLVTISDDEYDVRGIAYITIPEPGILALLTLGVLGLRRRFN